MKTDGRTSRWDAHRVARRAELVDAALRAIREHGATVGMDEVAAAAATSKTVVYRHFADRAQLYAAVCERVADVLVTQVQRAVDGADRPRAQVAAAIDAYLQLIENDPEVYRFVVHRPLVSNDPLGDLVSLVGTRVAAVIADHLTRSGHDPAPAVAWGHGVVGMVRAAADDWLSAGGADGTPRSGLAAHLTDLAWNGLSGPRTSEEHS